MLSLVLCVSLIFFAIWHVSTSGFLLYSPLIPLWLAVCVNGAQIHPPPHLGVNSLQNTAGAHLCLLLLHLQEPPTSLCCSCNLPHIWSLYPDPDTFAGILCAASFGSMTEQLCILRCYHPPHPLKPLHTNLKLLHTNLTRPHFSPYIWTLCLLTSWRNPLRHVGNYVKTDLGCKLRGATA